VYVDYKDIEHIDLNKIFQKKSLFELTNKEMFELETYVNYINHICETYEELDEDVADNLQMDLDNIVAFLETITGRR
jgi:hypothetical protein